MCPAVIGIVGEDHGVSKRPHQNRVTPTGEIAAISLRGAWTGNRGNLHRGEEIVRPWASRHWLVCSLSWKGTWHEQWQQGRLTWLFFYDEAVALAAGHRPCALCRRAAYNAYRAAWAAGGAPPSHDEMDRVLHVERVIGGSRQQRVHLVDWSDLPDGAFVGDGRYPALVRGRHLVAWTCAGYGDRRRRPRHGTAKLITPPSTVAVLQAGYDVQIDVSAG
jgi:hypothetical protein